MDLILSTPRDRREALQSCLAASAAQIARAAKILSDMEFSGDDLSGISPHIIRLLHRVGRQQMLPEVFTELAGRLRSRVSLLPLPMQRKILDGEPVSMVVMRENGVEVLRVDARKIEPAQVLQVFDLGRLRDESEQRAYIEAHTRRQPVSENQAEIEVLPNRGGIRVNGIFIPKNDLLDYLRQL